MESLVEFDGKPVEIGSLKVPQLKIVLRIRGKSTTGTKQQLQERLKSAIGSQEPDKDKGEDQPTEEPKEDDNKPNSVIRESGPETPQGRRSLIAEKGIDTPESIVALPFDPQIELLDFSITFGLCLETTDLSFSDLCSISPYSRSLYDSNEFWRIRCQMRYGTIPTTLPPNTDWRDFSEWCGSSAFITTPSGDFTELDRKAWRTLAAAQSVTDTAGADDARELEIDTNVRHGTTIYIAEIGGLWITFANYPGAERGQTLRTRFKLSTLLSAPVFDFLLEGSESSRPDSGEARIKTTPVPNPE